MLYIDRLEGNVKELRAALVRAKIDHLWTPVNEPLARAPVGKVEPGPERYETLEDHNAAIDDALRGAEE